MKRLSTLLLTLALALCLAPAAYADAVWTPDDLFFEEHYEECTYVGRRYYANGPEGYITLWDAPGSTTYAAQFENGFALTVHWLYEDWGCASVRGDEGLLDGWVPMDQLVLIYDSISFQEEHANSITPYNGEFAHFDGSTDGLVFWPYPGAAEPMRVWEGEDILPQLTGADGQESYISQIFVDESGLTWGHVPYLYGIRDAWFCLDEPTRESKGEDLPMAETPQVQPIPPQTPQPPAASILPYVLVAAVVVVTAGLLFWFYLRKKKKF